MNIKTSIAILITIFLLATPFALRADIAPMPTEAGAFFTMKREKVLISIFTDRVDVVANFTILTGDYGKKAPTRRHCHFNPADGEQVCGDYYYQFNYIYPVLKGQAFSAFKVYLNGEPTTFSKADHIKHEAVPGADHWILFTSPRYPPDRVKFPFETEIRVEYTEPIRFEKGRAALTYVLRSGALWKGKIGTADIVVNSVYKDLGFSIPPHTGEENRASWRFTSFEPDQDLIIKIKK